MALNMPKKPKQNFWDKVRDTFDANTEADYYRRAVQQAKVTPINQPIKRQSYAEQQTERGIGRVSNNAGARAINAGKSLWEGFNEAPAYIGKGLSYGSKQQQSTNASTISLQNQRAQELANARNRLRDPRLTPQQRSNYTKFVNTFQSDIDKINAQTDQDLSTQIKGTDPVKGAAYTAAMGFDVATAGVGSGGAVALKTAGKQGAKQFIKRAAIEGAKSAAVSGASEGIYTVGRYGSDVTAKDIAKGVGTGAAIGSVMPVGGYGASKVLGKVSPKVANVVSKGSQSIESPTKRIDDLITQSQKAFDVETNPTRRKQINQGISELLAERRAMSQGGYVQLPGAPKTPKVTAQGKAPISLPEKPKVNLKNPELEALNTDTAIRQMSSIMGEDIGQQSTELGLANKAIQSATGGRMTNLRGGNVFRTASDIAGKKITDASEATITGGGNKAVTGARSVFAGAGLADETKQIGRARTGKLANVEDLVKRAKDKVTAVLDSTPESRQALDMVMRDQKYIDRVYPGAKKLSPDTLSPELRQVHDQLLAINKLVNDVNYKTGVIDKEQWMGGSRGQHIGRIFNIPKNEKQMIRDTVGAMFEASPGIKRKDISKFTDEVIAVLDKDPAKAILIRQEIALRNLALQESMDAYASRGFIKKFSPNDQYVQVTGKRFGKYDGQFMERTVYEELTNSRVFANQFAQSFSDMLTRYKGSTLGMTDAMLKSFKTSMSPGTILGNVMSNIVAFTPGAGTNPLTQAADMIGAARKMSKGLADADVFEARQLGVIGGDTGKQMIGQTPQNTALREQSKNIFRRVHSRLGEFYGGIDDAAKLGLWTRLKKQGLSPQEAALEVAKFTQDYNNVGRAITLIADTPVMGKPFARFAPELVRIMKNNATRSPQGIVAGVGLLALINNRLSKASGESDEERKAREEAVGQTMIPGTAWINKLAGGPDRDISLNVPMGDTAVNIARAVGLNFPIEPGGDPTQALVESLIPVEIPTRKNAIGETEFDPTKIVTSMTARPIVEQLLDQNFMGKKVSDPSNTQYDSEGNVMKFEAPSAQQQRENRAKAAAVAYLPMGSEIDAFWSAAQGKPTVTGKTRTLPEAALRSIGIKTESNTPEDRKRRVDIQEYFEIDKEAENKFLRENKDLEQLYYSVNPKTKDRETGVKLSDQISPEKWTKVKSDTSGRLFEFMKSQALRKEKEGQPADPVFKLPSEEQKNIVLDLRSRPTGDDIETEEILRATQPWYTNFEKAERDYYAKSSAFFESLGLPDTQNQRAKDYANIPYPEQSELVKNYYATKAQDAEAGKQFFKDNADALSEAFSSYKAERLKYINAKRKIEGFDPIDENTFNNVTFGYEDDERKVYNELAYGKGYGGSGGGSKGPTKSYLKGPEQVATLKGKISLKSNKPQIKKFAVAKPKVSIKKSAV